MICKYCHTTLLQSAIYCHHCGKRQCAQVSRRHARRPHSQGSITKLSGRKHNPYWARLPADYSTGVPIRQSLGCFPTYKAAADAISLAISNSVLRHTSSVQTLADIYQHFVDSQYYASLSKGTQSSHRTAWSHMTCIANMPVSNINMDILQHPINQLHNKGLKRAALAKVRNLCSLLCREAIGLGILHTNYAHYIQLPKDDTCPAKPFDPISLQRIWAAADSGDTVAISTLLMIYTGMRPVEMLSIDISLHMHTIGTYQYVQIGSKTWAGNNRIIPIPAILKPIISALIGNRSTGPLISAPRGGHYRVDTWRSRCFRPLMERLLLVGYTPYSCRHTYADMQKRRHISPEIMRLIMGHEDYATTVERYHTTDEDILSICAAVDGITRPETAIQD